MTVVLEAKNRAGTPLAVIVGEILPAAIAIGLLALVGIVHVTSRVMVVKMGYELSRLDSQTTDLLRENDALKLELATLKSPARLETLARTKLGLSPPAAGAVIHVKD